MLIGGILWGILGDKKGRLSVLFGSIILYSLANIANGFVHTACIRTFVFHPRFPVDIRHNAKIGREKLALWAICIITIRCV